MKHARILLTATFASVLSACGGGSGGSSTPGGPVASTLSFPLRSAVSNLNALGGTMTLHATGTSATQTADGLCSGTLSGTAAPANTAATFEGQTVLSSDSTSTINFTNCTPSILSLTTTTYYDSNYSELGYSIQGGNYGVYQVVPNIPASVNVGNSGAIGTVAVYTDSTKTVSAGRIEKSYAIEADTATTAIANSISKTYDATGLLTSTVQVRYRINATGTFTPVSEDIQNSNTSTLHLVFR